MCGPLSFGWTGKNTRAAAFPRVEQPALARFWPLCPALDFPHHRHPPSRILMAPPPTAIRALRQDGVIELQWSGEPARQIRFKTLRENCPCAACVDEVTGERLLNPATVSETILPANLSFVGNYALKIVWTDGHSTGLYTWDHLARLAQP